MQKILRYIDWKLVLAVVLIAVIGLVFVYSALSKMPEVSVLFKKQVFAVSLGFICMIGFSLINYQLYYKNAVFIYVMSIILLTVVLILGSTIRGAKSWFDMGFLSFQPSEFARIAIILFLAVYLDKKYRYVKKLGVVFGSLFLTGIVIGLILLQPDFGSVLVFIPIVFGLLYVSGSSKAQLSLFALYGFISIGIPLYVTYVKMAMPTKEVFPYPFMTIIGIALLCYIFYYFINKFKIRIPFVWLVCVYLVIGLGIGSSFVVNKVLKDYQRKRLVVFLNPEKDHLGAGYNVIQSKVAVGSGGIKGKGLFAGTQGQLGFLPERHTDFIFSVVAEEAGFIGASVLMMLFGFVIYRIYNIAKNARDRFGSLIGVGVLISFAFYTIVNIGVVMGLMPVTGLPLPLVSYGGSSMLMTFISLGIVLNIGRRRFTN